MASTLLFLGVQSLTASWVLDFDGPYTGSARGRCSPPAIQVLTWLLFGAGETGSQCVDGWSPHLASDPEHKSIPKRSKSSVLALKLREERVGLYFRLWVQLRTFWIRLWSPRKLLIGYRDCLQVFTPGWSLPFPAAVTASQLSVLLWLCHTERVLNPESGTRLGRLKCFAMQVWGLEPRSPGPM